MFTQHTYPEDKRKVIKEMIGLLFLAVLCGRVTVWGEERGQFPFEKAVTRNLGPRGVFVEERSVLRPQCPTHGEVAL